MPHFDRSKVAQAKVLRATGRKVIHIARLFGVCRGTVERWLGVPDDYFDPLPAYAALSDSTKQVLIGSLLGDGSLAWHCVRTASFNEGHCLRQLRYLQWKRDSLPELSPTVVVRYGVCRLKTRRFRSLAKLRLDFYPNGVKVLPRTLLNDLGPLGLAVWWQDDGHRRLSKRLGRGIRRRTFPRSGCGVLNTQCFDKADVEWLASDFFPAKFGLTPRLYRQGKRTAVRCWALRFTGPDMLRLSNTIRAHVHDDLSYKVAPK